MAFIFFLLHPMWFEARFRGSFRGQRGRLSFFHFFGLLEIAGEGGVSSKRLLIRFWRWTWRFPRPTKPPSPPPGAPKADKPVERVARPFEGDSSPTTGRMCPKSQDEPQDAAVSGQGHGWPVLGPTGAVPEGTPPPSPKASKTDGKVEKAPEARSPDEKPGTVPSVFAPPKPLPRGLPGEITEIPRSVQKSVTGPVPPLPSTNTPALSGPSEPFGAKPASGLPPQSPTDDKVPGAPQPILPPAGETPSGFSSETRPPAPPPSPPPPPPPPPPEEPGKTGGEPGSSEPGGFRQTLRRIRKKISQWYKKGKFYYKQGKNIWGRVSPMTWRLFDRMKRGVFLSDPRLRLRYGFSDPFVTGMAHGMACQAAGMLLPLGVTFEPIPSFPPGTPYVRGSLRFRIAPWRMAWSFFAFMAEPELWKGLWDLGKWWRNRKKKPEVPPEPPKK